MLNILENDLVSIFEVNENKSDLIAANDKLKTSNASNANA